MFLPYTFFIYCYALIIKIAAFFNNKARLWVSGRKGLLSKIEEKLKNEQSALVWVHASSLGEFEQGRPVIDCIRTQYPHFKILLTFFSPSGYEVRKTYAQVDYVFYLPADTPENAERFVKLINPKIALFIKYEYWFNYLDVLHKNNIPVCFISAIFRPNHYFFRFYGKWALNKLRKINHFFVQNELSAKLLQAQGISNVSVSGDTRFDRVKSISEQSKEIPFLSLFSKAHKVIIAGSTWSKDEELIIKFINTNAKGLKFIIAPHEINKPHLTELKQRITRPCCFFSELDEQNAVQCDVIIVDGIGYLSGLYRYAHVAFIGGGFGSGIHNILEAACFGLPVFFGPNYQKFSEAIELIEKGSAFSMSGYADFEELILKLLKDHNYYAQLSDISKNYVIQKSGATKHIMNMLSEKFL